MEGNWIFVDFYVKSIPTHKSGHDGFMTIQKTSNLSNFIQYINPHQPMNKLLEMKRELEQKKADPEGTPKKSEDPPLVEQ